jgi:hypothetical protein
MGIVESLKKIVEVVKEDAIACINNKKLFYVKWHCWA